MQIKSKVDTILKALPLPTSELEPDGKFNIYKDFDLECTNIALEQNDHISVDIDGFPIARAYLYAPHWQIPDDRIILPASYYYQIDNPSGDGPRECCGTSNAILLNWITNGRLDEIARQKRIEQPESIYLDRLAEYGDTTDHNANTAALLSFGIDSYWSTSLRPVDYFEAIRKQIGMVLGLEYKRAGHIVFGVGFDINKRQLIIHDPNGAREGTTDYWISNSPEAGKFDEYSVDSFIKLWLPDGNGWGRIVTSIDGRPTGMD